MQTCNLVTSYFHEKKKVISDMRRKCILPNMNRVVPVLFIFGNIYFLLISEKEFLYEIKRDGMTSFTDFMGLCSVHLNPLLCLPNARKSMDFKCHYPMYRPRSE